MKSSNLYFYSSRFQEWFAEQPFTKETHYFWTALALALLSTVLLYEIQSQDLIRITSDYTYLKIFSNLPAISYIDRLENINIERWKSIYCIEFSLTPVYVLLGLCGAFHYSKERHEKVVINTSWKKIIAGILLMAFLAGTLAFGPDTISGHPLRIDFWNPNITILTLASTWMFVSMVFYFLGLILILPLQKLISLKISRSM